MGAGKGYVLHYMNQHGYFPLPSFVIVDPDEIRSHFPEYNLYKSENPFLIMKQELIYLRTYCTKYNVALPYIIY